LESLRFPSLAESDGARLLVESGKLFARCLDKDVLFHVFRNVVEQTLGADGILVSSFNPSTAMIRCVFACVDGEVYDESLFPDVAFESEPGRGMQSEIIRTGEARLFADVSRRVEEGTGTYYQTNEGELQDLPKGSSPKAQSAMMAPLKLDGEVIGVTQVMADRYAAYSDRHLVFFEGIALQMGLALHNAELFEEKQREIAERVKAEEALIAAEKKVSELNAALEELVAKRTQELKGITADFDAFCYSVSHDLRTPLRGISGSAMILLEDHYEQLPEDAKEQLLAMRSAVGKMGVLIDGLLKLSRLGRSPLLRTPIDLSKIAKRTKRSAKNSPDADLQVAEEMKIEADGDMLDLAMEHLLDNAFKFSASRTRPAISVGEMAMNGERVFFVKDNGIGFDNQYAPKLFLPFERLHRDHEYAGTGIGLALVKRIVERHGGRIWAEGIPGEGASFYFTLVEPS
jgi:signal transduction histidine kinase